MMLLPVVAAALLAATMPAQADVQKCRDAAGKVHFSDRGCTGVGEKVRGAPDAGAHTIGTQDHDRQIADQCLDRYRAQTGNDNADSTRVESFAVKWVSVRNVGPRRLFTINVGLRSAAGQWWPADRYECLLRGDNVSFQTTPYELTN